MSEQNGEKTEKATPRKRKQARENAQVLKSTELIAAASLLVMFAVLSGFGDNMVDRLEKLFTQYLGVADSLPDALDIAYVRRIMLDVILRMGMVLLPVLAAAVLSGLLFNYVQVGFLFTGKGLMPKLDRISMISGFKRFFSKRTFAQLIKTLIKTVVLGVVAYSAVKKHLNEFPNTMELSVPDAAAYMTKLLFSVARALAIVLLIMGPVDWFYEWRRHEKDLMMTKQELKDEYKLTEGDPQTKGRVRRKQREISGRRMIQAVSKADVVVTNPTHFAVALAYDEKKNKAPVVVAKGQDYLAKKIKEKAIEKKITIMENKPLARALYASCDINDEVPEELYQAVAEILAYVYKLKNKKGGGRA